jgi:hypothetical protein
MSDVIPDLKATEDGCIPEADIINAIPKDLIPAWTNFINGQTVSKLSNGDWGIYEGDYQRFRRNVINYAKREQALNELAAQAQELNMGYENTNA